jgi:hypothetical protein
MGHLGLAPQVGLAEDKDVSLLRPQSQGAADCTLGVEVPPSV